MNLIYSVAYGSDAWHQAAIMVQSLRRAGQFTGEIIVYSDTKAELLGAEVVHNLEPLTFYSPKLAKAYFGKQIDASKYERIMFLDSDIVAIKPIQPLFELEGICAPWDGVSVEHPFFNSGTIVAPASEWNRLCRRWWHLLAVSRLTEGPWVDQPLFNALVNEGAISVKPMPEGSVHLFLPQSNLDHRCILAHVTWPCKERTMQAIYALTNPPDQGGRLIVGAGPYTQEGWLSLQQHELDITRSEDWQHYLSHRITHIVAEHVLEHIPVEKTYNAVKMMFNALAPGGRVRIAVPDGRHPDPAYQEHVAPPVNGHTFLWDFESLSRIMLLAGFRVELIEWWDSDGFNSKPWDAADGMIHRSFEHDERNKDGKPNYTSLIIDGIKPSA
jgi:predicted SAM-dependent methyltransferase